MLRISSCLVLLLESTVELEFQQMNSDAASTRIPVGISACLLGEKVRYDGGHKQSKMCLGNFAEFFDYHSFCPEVSAGFGTPRPTMRLIGDPNNPILTYVKNGNEDLSEKLRAGFVERIESCATLDGYILMKKSPSCGMERIRVYREDGMPHQQTARGLFADALIKRHPQLPVEEEARLNDDKLCENFVMRVFVHHRFRQDVLSSPTYKSLLDFHSSHKYLLMAHSQVAYRELGRMLAESSALPFDDVLADYFPVFMRAISSPATRAGHCNVLQHILGYLKKTVPGSARQDIDAVIAQYRRGDVNLATPLTLLSHHIQQSGSDYVRMQRYLMPYPSVLGLGNRI